MQRQLNDVWNEEKMLGQLQQVRQLTKAFTLVPDAKAEKRIRSITNFIEVRRGEVQAELDQPALDWPDLGGSHKPGERSTMEVSGEFSSVFMIPEPAPVTEDDTDETLFATIPANLLGTGQASIEFTIDGETQKPFTAYGVRTISSNPDFIRDGYPVIELIASSDAGHPPWRLSLILDPYQLSEGENRLEIDHFTVWARLTQGEAGSDDVQTTGFGISGTLELDEFAQEPGAPVSGRFRLKLNAFE
jgi:hypothetical protein